MTQSCPWSSPSLFKRQQPDTGKQLLDLLQQGYQAQFAHKSLIAAVGTSFGIAFAIFVLFCLIRPHNAVVYAPRLKHTDAKHAPPPIDNGYFSWLIPVFKCREEDLWDKLGLDAIVFLRFLRLLRNLFAVLSLLCLVMIVVNVGCSVKNKGELGKNPDPLIYTSPRAVHGECLAAHVIMAWVFNIITCLFIWRSYRALLNLKTRYFESSEYQASLQAKTLMVTDVPKKFQSNDGLADIIARIKVDPQLTEDQKARIARDVKELPKMVEEHEMTVRRLESVLAKYLKNPDVLPTNRPTMKPFKDDRKTKGNGKVDAIEYLDERLKLLETRIKEVRSSVDLKQPLPYGFVSFSTMQNAHTVAHAAKGKHPEGTRIVLAPRPTDLLWDNLAKTKGQRRWGKVWGWMLYIFLTIIWIVPNAFIATFLMDISRIGALWPSFAGELYRDKNFWALVQGFAAPLVLSLVLIVLPIVMRRISARQGDFTKTARERHATSKLFSFFIFHQIIVFTIFGVLWTFIAKVISDSSGGATAAAVWESVKKFKFASGVVDALFGVARWFIIYLLQRNLGSLLDLIQLVTLIWRWYSRKFLSPTPREMIEWSAPQHMDFTPYYNYFLFYATIAFTFAPVQPLIIPVACLYFTLDSFFRKYALMYMFATKTESGGLFWRMLVNRILIAASFGNIVTAMIMWVNRVHREGEVGDIKGTIGALIPLLGLIGFKIYVAKTFDDKLYFYTASPASTDAENAAAAEAAQKKHHRDDRLSDRYGHPALTRKLLTPLVHEKAKHVLARVYSIRIGEDNEPFSAVIPLADESVGMMSMQSDKPGHVAHQQLQPPGLEQYNFIKESQLDYHNLGGRERQEFGINFDPAAARPSSTAPTSPNLSAYNSQRPVTPGDLSVAESSGTSRTETQGYFSQQQPGQPMYSALGSPGLGPQQLTLTHGPTARATSPLARGTSSSPGYFSAHEGDSDSDVTGLLGAPQTMGRSTPGGFDGRLGSAGGQEYHQDGQYGSGPPGGFVQSPPVQRPPPPPLSPRSVQSSQPFHHPPPLSPHRQGPLSPGLHGPAGSGFQPYSPTGQQPGGGLQPYSPTSSQASGSGNAGGNAGGVGNGGGSGSGNPWGQGQGQGQGSSSYEAFRKG
ncbi:hypothetical protein Dda_4058 [Drechslerella dactyloides]|uniref:DUF221-domain-containing protein n=1 Tax=Drechslerella dactyloides TaxID=74499 RepID=A0AAD6IZ18_DREDA|nr:hypothetical protein Dda_4058 [Drechslerella dactyloides]